MKKGTKIIGWWNAGSSFLAWWLCGKISCHSRLDERLKVKTTGRWENKASQIRKMKNSRDTKETTDPIEEITFHNMYASG